MARCTAPPEGPLRPQNPPGPFTPRKTPDESTWGSPLRRTVTLTDGVRRATKKCPAHSLLRTISGRCCVKNTQSGHALTARMNSNLLLKIKGIKDLADSSTAQGFFGDPCFLRRRASRPGEKSLPRT